MVDCKVIKKCPKCKKKMLILTNGFGDYNRIQSCDNDKCIFYGIERYCKGTSFKDKEESQ